MTFQTIINASVRQSVHFWKCDDGGISVEFAIVVALLFFILFSLFDFGRVAFSQVMAENAVEIAARTAVVRPPACAGVPTTHTRGTASPAPRYGTSCSVTNACASVATITCAGNAANATANEIWTRVSGWTPAGTQIQHMQFTYTYDANLGFLGGPYTPVVTVDINAPNYTFVSPLAALARAAGAASPALGASFAFPTFSASHPAEDLNHGDLG